MFRIIILKEWFQEDQKRLVYQALLLIKYLLTFYCSQTPPSGSQYVEDLEGGFSSDVESKYKKMYEDDINPFAAFSKKVPALLPHP